LIVIALTTIAPPFMLKAYYSRTRMQQPEVLSPAATLQNAAFATESPSHDRCAHHAFTGTFC